MKKLLENLKIKAEEKLEHAKTISDVESLRIELLGKKGALVDILKGLKDLPIDSKKEVGMLANKLKQDIERLLTVKKE